MPLELGDAKLQRTTHTLVHYYSTEILSHEFSILNSQYIAFLSNVSIDHAAMPTVEPQLKNINFTIATIKEKLAFTKPSTAAIHTHKNKTKTRSRRGLLNVLGSGIKLVTGNLDDSDGQRYETILDQLKKGETILENQVKQEYSINTKIIDKYNSNLQTIRHNEQEFASRLVEIDRVLRDSVSSTEHKLLLRDAFNQLSITFINFLTIVEDLENALLFCHVNTFHPSIIKPSELLFELKRIERFYKEELPLATTPENLPFFEELIDVHCKITPSDIVFFLSVPINHKADFTLYYMLPIPTLHLSEYITVRVSHRYILKNIDNNEIIPLKGPCQRLTQLQCSNPDSSVAATCETGILETLSSEHCEHAKVDISVNRLENIPESNKLLGIFLTQEHITLNCPHHAEEHDLSGIYLLNPGQCSLTFRNRTIPRTLTSETKPLFFQNPMLLIESPPNLKTSFHFTQLSEDPELNDIPPPEMEIDFLESHKSHFWAYSCILLLIFIVVIYFATKCYFASRRLRALLTFSNNSATATDNPETTEDQELNLLPPNLASLHPLPHVGFHSVPQS